MMRCRTSSVSAEAGDSELVTEESGGGLIHPSANARKHLAVCKVLTVSYFGILSIICLSPVLHSMRTIIQQIALCD